MENFDELARDLTAAGAATQIADAQGLAAFVQKRLGDPEQVVREAAAAMAFAAQGAGTLDRVLVALSPVLASLGPEAIEHARA
jgi:3-deoxy-D-manno-octulosonic-acid transferase